MLTRKMKDSGIEWIGKIPEEWMITSLQRLFFIQAGGDAKKEYYNSKRDKKYCYPVYTNSKDEHSVYAYTSNPIFPANCITVSGRGAIGKAFYRKTPFDAIIRLLVLKPKTKSISEFYTYFIDTVLVFNTGSSAVGQLSTIQIAPYKVAVPPIEEQQSIVNVLNKKTERISLIIKQTQQSIEELKKYKQSLITEAVTKGLDPNVEMKDSGINWVERIPAHWNVNKGKYLFNKMDRPIEIEETVTAFRDGQVVQRKKRRTDGFTNSLKEIGYQGVKQGDLVIHSMDAFAGAIGISEDDGKCSPVCIVLDSENPNIYNPYFSYLMRVYSILGYIESMSKGIRVRSTDFKHNTFANTLLLFPSFVEQKEIVNYIEEETSLIDKLITDKTKVIEELEEYKKSLIYEYVTGKKEV